MERLTHTPQGEVKKVSSAPIVPEVRCIIESFCSNSSDSVWNCYTLDALTPTKRIFVYGLYTRRNRDTTDRVHNTTFFRKKINEGSIIGRLTYTPEGEVKKISS